MARNRFYDLHPLVSQSVEVLLVFPPQVQSVIAAGMSRIAEDDFKAKQLLEDVKSLGVETVLALYKSKAKRREYDKNPVVHQAMVYYSLIDTKDRISLAKKSLELMGMVKEYLKLCQQYGVKGKLEDLEAIRDRYIRTGTTEARQFIQALEEKLASGFTVRSSDDQGMWIKGDGP